MAAKYPASVATDADLLVASDNAYATLNGAITNVQTSIVITAGGGTIGVNNVISVGAEQMLVTAVAGSTLTVTRGFAGTTAASALTGAGVNVNVTATHHNALKDELKAIENTLLNGSLGIGTATPKGLLDVSDGTRHSYLNPRATAAGALAAGMDIASWDATLNLIGAVSTGLAGAGVVMAANPGGAWVRGFAVKNAATLAATTGYAMPDGGGLVMGLPNASPGDSALGNSNFFVWVNESTNTLTFRVKYSNGTLKTATLALT